MSVGRRDFPLHRSVLIRLIAPRVSTGLLFHRQEKRETLAARFWRREWSGLLLRGDDRGHHQATLRFFAFAVGLNAAATTKVFVDKLSLDRVHRLERHRPSVIHGRLNCLIRGRTQRFGSTRAIARRVDDNRLARSRAGKGGAVRQVLDRVKRATVVCEQYLGVPARKFPHHALRVLAHDDLYVQIGGPDDLAQ
jgi:hypothetical protein